MKKEGYVYCLMLVMLNIISNTAYLNLLVHSYKLVTALLICAIIIHILLYKQITAMAAAAAGVVYWLLLIMLEVFGRARLFYEFPFRIQIFHWTRCIRQWLYLVFFNFSVTENLHMRLSIWNMETILVCVLAAVFLIMYVEKIRRSGGHSGDRNCF